MAGASMKRTMLVVVCAASVASSMAWADPAWVPRFEAGVGLAVVSRQSFYTRDNPGAFTSLSVERAVSDRLAVLLGAAAVLAYDEGCQQDQCGPKLSTTLAAVVGVRYRFTPLWTKVAVGPALYRLWGTGQPSNVGAMAQFVVGKDLSQRFDVELQTSLTVLAAAAPMEDGNHANRVVQISAGVGYHFE